MEWEEPPCAAGVLTRKGVACGFGGGGGCGGAATAGGGFGMTMSFWHDGHLVCMPAHSGPQAMCCEQWGQENLSSLITRLGPREHMAIGAENRFPINRQLWR